MGLCTRYFLLFWCLLHMDYTESDQNELASKRIQQESSVSTTMSSLRNISVGANEDDAIQHQEIIEEDFSFNCDEGLPLLRFASAGVIVIFLAMIGFVSNTLLFLAAYRQRYHQSTHLIIRALAIVDIVILIICVVAHSIRIITSCGLKWHFYQRNHKMIFVVFYPILYCTRTLSIWLTTLLAIDRWQAISHPQVRENGSRRHGSICKLICVICGSIIVSLPRFFEYYLDSNSSLQHSDMTHNKAYTIIYKIILFFLSTYLVPMVLMILFNTRLIVILKHGQIDSKKSRSITFTVVMIVLIFIACNIPPMVSHLIWSLETAFPSMSHLEQHRRPMTNITNVLVALHCVANFFVYFFCSKSFRHSLIKLFGCCQKNGRPMGSSQSSTTNISKCSTGSLDQDTKI